MFSWTQSYRVDSTLPPDAFRNDLERQLDTFGDIEVHRNGDISISAGRFSSFGFNATLEVVLEEGRKPDQYRIETTFKLTPTSAGLVLGILFFFPVGLILLLSGMNNKQQLEGTMRQVIDDLEGA